jgi:hypothetical protein
MPPIVWVIITIVIISTVVGAVAKLLSNLNEMNAARNRPPGPADGGGAARAAAGGGGGGSGGATIRQSSSDMDRFLAEIDRLRKKTADAPPPPPNQTPAAPVVQPTKQPDRPRPRVVAELADPMSRPDTGFAPTVPTATTGPKAGDLPMASVVTLPGGTGAPATRVTRFAGRPRPVAKTPFAKNLTSLLTSGQGLALAIVLQEVLAPPKCQKA